MPSDSGFTTSVWMESPVPTFPPLQGEQRADVCVIGAGIAGLTTAFLLVQAGLSVIVVDDGPIGSGATGRTTAHLASALDDRYYELARVHGTRGAQLAAASHSAAVNLIETIVNNEGIACEFERLDGYLFMPPGEGKDVLDKELAAAHRAGLRDVHFVERAPLSFFDTGPCLRFPRQGQFHPLHYLTGLARAIERRHGRIFTGTHATEIAGGRPGLVKTTANGSIRADAIVVATNTPINDRVVMHTKQAPYRSYVVGLRVPRGAVPKGLYWDTPDPYHYVRLANMPQGGDELLIVGGEDHKTGQVDDTAEPFTRLESWTRERFPMAAEVAYRWSGQVMEPVDSLGFIGRNPGDDANVYIVTGDSGNGMTHGSLAGLLLRDLILGIPNPWTELYDPSRKSLKAAGEFARENLNVAAQYTDLVTGGEVASLDAIAPGSGAVLRQGLSKVAVYRDEAGQVHAHSAICTHLECVVHWNSTEKLWDCPCHGSQFAVDGRVVNGPANTDLAPVELKELA